MGEEKVSTEKDKIHMALKIKQQLKADIKKSILSL